MSDGFIRQIIREYGEAAVVREADLSPISFVPISAELIVSFERDMIDFFAAAGRQRVRRKSKGYRRHIRGVKSKRTTK